MVRSLKTLAQPAQEVMSDRAAVEREFNRELLCLVQTKGWHYAQRVANQIQQEYVCTPKDPDWQVYTTIQFALNQLFERIRVRVKQIESAGLGSQSILAEMKENDDDRSRRSASTKSGTTGGNSRRRRTSK